MNISYLHTMVRVSDLTEVLDFYCDKSGPGEVERYDCTDDRFTLVMLAAPGNEGAQIELTSNCDHEEFVEGRNVGHLAYSITDIYTLCLQWMDTGMTINRCPRDGRMAVLRSPDNISIELLQEGQALGVRGALASMPNQGHG